MIAACPVPATGGAFLEGVLDHIDCQAQTLGMGGYQALAAPGSPVTLVATGLLTLFVALLGIRMLMGEVPELRDGVLAVVKIGIVLLLATSWPAYRTIAYDVVLHGPAELASAIGQPAALPGSGGGLVARLQNADNLMLALAERGTGGLPALGGPPVPGAQLTAPAPRSIGFEDATAFGSARVVYLAGTIGALAIVRLAAGLLLALAPLFAGLLLFDGTRGWFIGWLRGLVAAGLGALGVTIVLGVELALLEPWLADALTQRLAHVPTPAAPTELLVMTLGFAVALFGLILVAGKVAFALHLSSPWRLASQQVGEALRPQARSGDAVIAVGSPAASPLPSRALAIADAVSATQRREAEIAGPTARAISSPPGSSASREAAVATMMPLGQSFRRTRTRISPGAARRDRPS